MNVDTNNFAAAMLGEVLEFLFGPPKDRFWSLRFERKQERIEVCRAAIARMTKERPNLLHILAGKPFSGESHRRAVTQSSFELLHQAMIDLSKEGRFQRIANLLDEQLIKRDAGESLKLMNELEPKLRNFCNR